ncbi:MAG: hypothetical protein NTU48_07495 [Legionellales bacterium]|nr:hypothetical protein [Legionellales bacterium]
MKKAIVAFLLTICAQTYAVDGCSILKVSVKNDSPSTCYLIERTVKSGSIHKRQLYRILSGSKVTQFEIAQAKNQSASIQVTYECGENHSVSFLSNKGACMFSNPGKVEGKLVNATNMTAVFTTTEGSYLSEKSALIDWIIS